MDFQQQQPNNFYYQNQQQFGAPYMGAIPQGTGMQYNGNIYNQYGQYQNRSNILTDDEVQQLLKKENQFSLDLTETERLRATCSHRWPNGQKDALIEENGQTKCAICGYVFNPLSYDTSLESIKNSIQEVEDVLQTIKLLWYDVNVDAAREFFPIIGLLEKTPQLFEIAAKNFAKHNEMNPWSYNAQNMGTMQLFQVLSGIINGNAPVQPQMQQPMMGGMGQPQAPFGMPGMNPMQQQPMSNGFGYVGAQPAYAPNTQGFATQYGAPVQQPVADSAAQPVAENKTADASATKA